MDLDELIAAAIKSHSTETSDAPWSASENEKRLPNDGGASDYRDAYAWVDPEGDPDTKGAYSFIHHEVSSDGEIGPANTRACSSTVAILNGGRGGTTIPDGDRRGVYNHVIRHLKDSGVADDDLPELMAVEIAEAIRVHNETLHAESVVVAGGMPLGSRSFVVAGTEPRTPVVASGEEPTFRIAAALVASGARFGVEQVGDRWHVLNASGVSVEESDSYTEALEVIRDSLSSETRPGLLPERWRSDMAYEGVSTGDGRRIAEGAIEFRDCPLPLMLQTENDIGHFGAVLAGVIERASKSDGIARGEGSFDDNEFGVQARDIIVARTRFGVSIDGGRAEAEFVCTERDADGDCIDGEMVFSLLEIMGLTMTPFPAFADAFIEIAPAEAETPSESVAASGESYATTVVNPDGTATTVINVSVTGDPGQIIKSLRTGTASLVAASAASAPPRDAFDDPGFAIGDGRLVLQPTGCYACPLTVTDDRRVFAHVASWGQCHTGYSRCVPPPHSRTNYAAFNLRPLMTAEGEVVHVGHLSMGCGHASDDPSTPVADVRAHYDGGPGAIIVADVRAGEDEFGPWIAGMLRPELTDEQLEAFMLCSLSGDWREVWRGKGLDLLAVLAGVTVPGYPIAAIAASGALSIAGTIGDERARFVDGELVALVAAGVVRRPMPWERTLAEQSSRIDELELRLAAAERITAAVRPVAAERIRGRLPAVAAPDREQRAIPAIARRIAREATAVPMS